MNDQKLEITPSPSSDPQPQKLGFGEIRRIHEKSFGIAKDAFPEKKGILSKFRNRDLKHNRRALAREISLHNVVTELSHKDKVIQAHAEGLVDPLTQIKNLEGFRESVAEEMARMQREETEVRLKAQSQGRDVDPSEMPKSSLLFIDADDFKLVNDNLGHNEGDRVLQAIANALKESAHREPDTPARVGGDEFALLLPGTDTAGAVRLVTERLIPALNGIRVSIGIAPLNSTSFLTAKEQADRAMYVAKKSSKETPIEKRTSQYRVYDEATMQNIVIKN